MNDVTKGPMHVRFAPFICLLPLTLPACAAPADRSWVDPGAGGVGAAPFADASSSTTPGAPDVDASPKTLADTPRDGGGSADLNAPQAAAHPRCGTEPCDLTTSTCCVPADGSATAAVCEPGATSTCPKGSGAFHCQSESDCAGGGLCCGVYDLSAGTAQTQCQKGSCQIAQLCAADSECLNRQPCVEQTCQGSAVLRLCGVQGSLGCTRN
jgi:hypothetical protein